VQTCQSGKNTDRLERIATGAPGCVSNSRFSSERLSPQIANTAAVGRGQKFHRHSGTNPQIRLVFSDYFLPWRVSGTVRHTLRLSAKRTRSREDFYGCANLCPELGNTVG
jgi:hypothetical protein